VKRCFNEKMQRYIVWHAGPMKTLSLLEEAIEDKRECGEGGRVVDIPSAKSPSINPQLYN